MAEKKVKELFQFRASSADFESAEEHNAFLEFVKRLTIMRKTSDFFRNAVLDAFRLEQKEKEEQEMYGELQQYIKENGIEKTLKNAENGEFFTSIAKVTEEEKVSYQYLLQTVKKMGVDVAISRLDDNKPVEVSHPVEVKVDMNEIVQNVLDALKKQGVDIKEDQQEEVKQSFKATTKSDLDLLDDMG
ncbi:MULTISPECIES: hypothetical protein [Bacillus]|uniref:hypothetical protein n=1 Tax=Bacillus TaxID=1386 RepID=UPI001BB3A9A9|nr:MULTISPECIES: hypothetical protein [Bacillus]BCC80211.1 hypothetical protein BCJMU62_p220 [Bacillus cereus]GMB79176.1 hypothetical protein BCER1_55770 [Bacillus cereus]